MELRTITPVTGRPPSEPEAMLAAPCPISSRLRLARGPVCILSVATADSRLSTLATSATVTTAMPKPNQPPPGKMGANRMSSTFAGTSTRGTVMPKATDTTVTATTAASGPGIFRTGPGNRAQASRIPMVSRPSTVACP